MPAVRLKTTLGDRAFMVAAPTLWNSLPKERRAITNVNSFKAHFKTCLFPNCIVVINFKFSSHLHAYIFFLFFIIIFYFEMHYLLFVSSRVMQM